MAGEIRGQGDGTGHSIMLIEATMFETQYNEEMEAEVRRFEGKSRAAAAGHPEWDNAFATCGCELPRGAETCAACADAAPSPSRNVTLAPP